MSVGNIFRFIGVSFIPIVLTVLIYIGFKHVEKRLLSDKSKKLPKILSTEKRRYWTKQIIVGVVLGGFSIACYFLGVEVKDYLKNTSETMRVSISTFFPVISGLVFGWPSAAITTVIAAIFRMCMPSFLRWATVTACLLGGGLVVVAGKFLFDNKRSRWYFAFFTGVFVESLNMLLLFLFNLKQIGNAYLTIRQFDAICILCNGFAALITCLVIQLIEKEPILLHFRKDKRINTRIQIALLAICTVGLLLTSSATYIVSYADAFDTVETLLYDGSYDMHYDFKTMKARTSPFFCVNRHYVSDGGFCLTIALGEYTQKGGSKDGIHLRGNDGSTPTPDEKIEGHEDLTDFKKGTVFGLPENHIDEYKEYIGKEEFKFDDGTTPDSLIPNIIDADNKKFEYHYAFKSLLGKRYLVTCNKEINDDCDDEVFTDSKHYRDTFYSLVFIPTSEITESAGISYRVVTYLNLILFISLFAIVYSILDKKVIKNIEIMDAGLEKIMEGNINDEIVIKSSYHEFETLSNNVNLAIGALKNYAQEVEHRMAAELKVARDIQVGSLPTAFPIEKEYNIYALMNPAKEVGGDFYDYIKVNNGRILLINADVSGKGIPAAMFMMRAKTLFKSLASTTSDLAEIMYNANNVLCEDNESDMFVTAWVGLFNPETGELNYVNAGHTIPLINRNNKFEQFINKHNVVLAAIPNTKFEVETIYLEPGQEILVYTDGVTEAINDKTEMYGIDRLIKVANSTNYFNAKQLLTNLSDDIAKYSNGVEQFDDITMSLLIYTGKGEENPENTLTLIAKPISTTVAINYVESVLASRELNSKFIARISIVIDELFANVAFYAYPKGKEGNVTVTVDTRDDMLRIRLIDSGTPFDPTAKEDPNVNASIDDRKRGGLGIFIVKNTMDDVRYEYSNFQNILYLDKKITKEDKIQNKTNVDKEKDKGE